MNGWMGKILKIDVGTGEVTTTPTEAYVDDYLGGRGIGLRLICDLLKPGTKPLDPGNPLIFSMGPLSGTAMPSSGRTDVTALSPQNNLRGRSNFGGYWGPEAKYAGYDHIILTGKAEKPVYVWITDDKVELRDASQLWGKDTFETQQLIQRELGDPEIKVICIGPAGENLVRFACLITEYAGAAGRGGLGAVMGSKNVKAIAVRGSKSVGVAHPEDMLRESIALNQEIRESPACKELGAFGVVRFVSVMYKSSFFPVGYFEDVDWEEMNDKYGGPAYLEKHQKKNVGCFACPIRCKNFLHVPEFGKGFTTCEPWSGFTGSVWNTDLDVFWQGTQAANRLGLDATETSASIGLLMELFHEKIISAEDTDGIAMERGSKEAILGTIRKIAHREGYGAILADGQRAFAEKVGPKAVEKLDLVKGLAPHPYEFRAYHASGLMQAVGHRGDPLPMRGSLLEFEWQNAPDWFQQVAEKMYGNPGAAIPNSYEGKASSTVLSEHNGLAVDSMGVCTWPYANFVFHSIDKAVRMLQLVTGKDWDVAHVLKISERLRNLERMFDVRQGMTREQDALPNKFFETPLARGKYQGAVLDRAKFEKMKDEYYTLRGWDLKTGIPTGEKLAELRLSAVVEKPVEK
jgi:aldehyde:ferredoxin oxidoreductase